MSGPEAQKVNRINAAGVLAKEWYRMNPDQQILIEALRNCLASIEETINNLKGS